MGVKFTNNAESTLALPVDDTQTTVTLFAGDGALFPSLAAGDWFPMYLIRDATFDGASPPNVVTNPVYEIVRVISRVGDVLGVQRAQEGVVARTFAAGDRVSLRLTQAAIESFAISGNESLTIKRGINFGVDTGSVNAIEVTVRDIGTYTDKLVIDVYMNFTNTGPVTLAVNALAVTAVKLPGDVDVAAGMMLAKQTYTLRYDNGDSVFVLEGAGVVTASESVAGIVRLASDAEQLAGTDTQSAATPAGVHQAIDDKLAGQSEFSSQWHYRGNGSDGDRVFNTSFSLTCGHLYQYSNFTLAGNITLTATQKGVLLILCTGKALIEGDIIGARAREELTGVGGRGGWSSDGVEPQHLFIGGTAGSDTPHDRLIASVLRQSIPFVYFQGGKGADVLGDVRGLAPEAAGGLVIIANEIELTSSATIDLHGFPPEGSGGVLSGGSGGGCVVLASKVPPVIDPGAKIFVGLDGDETNTQRLGPVTSGGGIGWIRTLTIP